MMLSIWARFIFESSLLGLEAQLVVPKDDQDGRRRFAGSGRGAKDAFRKAICLNEKRVNVVDRSITDFHASPLSISRPSK